MKDDDMNRARMAFWVLAFVLGGVVAYVIWRFIGTFVFGLFLYYSTRPVYRRLEQYTRYNSLAAAASLFILALPALLLVGYTVAIGIKELDRTLTSTQFATIETLLGPYVDVSTVVSDPMTLLESGGTGAVTEFLAGASSLAGFFAILAVHVFLMLAIAFYLLRDDHKLATWFLARFSDQRGVIVRFGNAVDSDLHKVFFGNILNALITGAVGAIVYSLLDAVAPAGMGVPYAAVLGLLAGVASLVPVVGMKLVYVPVSAYLFAVPFLAELDGVFWFPIVFLVVSLVVVDTIPDLIVRPYVSGRTLHVGAVMVAYIVGPLLFGWYGIFLAPFLLVLVVQFGRIVVPELIAGDPIEPAEIDPTPAYTDSDGTDQEPVETAESNELAADEPEDGDAATESTDPDAREDQPNSTDETEQY